MARVATLSTNSQHSSSQQGVVSKIFFKIPIVVIMPVKIFEMFSKSDGETTGEGFPLISTVAEGLSGFIVWAKASKVRQQWNEATEALAPVFAGAANQNDRTRNGTRGTSSDGIQRHKIGVTQ
jgi:hypothetical protein